MRNPIRARVKGGVIEPLEQIGLPGGQEVMVTILAPTDREAFRPSARQWKKGTLDAEALIRDIYVIDWFLQQSPSLHSHRWTSYQIPLAYSSVQPEPHPGAEG